MTTSPPDEPSEEVPLETLVDSWLPIPDVASRLAVPLSAVRRMVEDGDLLALRVGEDGIRRVPEKFLGPEGPLAALRGTFTVLSDGGMSEEETVRWLFTPDPTLPVEGAPIDAIIGGFKTEVRRRAMEQAF